MGPIAAMLAGGISAVGLNFALANADTPLIFLSYFTALPIFLVGLGAGGVNALIAAGFGALVLLLAVGPALVLIYGILFALPAAVLSQMALRHRQDGNGKNFWYPEGSLLLALALYASLLFVVALIIMASQDGGLLGATTRLFEATLPLLVEMARKSGEVSPDQIAQLTTSLPLAARIVPSILGSSWIFLILISALAAQGLLRQQNWQIRDRFTLQNIYMPNWLMFITACAAVAAVLAPPAYSYVAGNLTMLLCLPFFFVGLAVIHAFAAAKSAPGWWPVPFYLLLAVIPHLGIFVTLLGALDQGLQLRQKLQKASA